MSPTLSPTTIPSLSPRILSTNNPSSSPTMHVTSSPTVSLTVECKNEDGQLSIKETMRFCAWVDDNFRCCAFLDVQTFCKETCGLCDDDT